jgi:4-amino-4-deoxy-L-arabinose transferase-like glycosyltransferase
MKNKIIISLIFLIALILRFWNLSSYPDAIDEDEMALGYNAYSLLNGGIDEWGNKFPIYFESGGDYKYGIYSYITTFPVAIFDLNAFSTRFASALFGSLSVIAIYFLVKELSKNEKLSLISAFVLSVSPTFVHFSRVGYNNVLGVFFAVVCITLYLKWVKKTNKKNLLLCLLFFLLSIYSYQAYRIFVPAVIFTISVIHFIGSDKSTKVKLILSTIFFVGIVLASFIPAASRIRTQDYSILINKPGLVEEFAEDNKAGVLLPVTRIFHNKVIEIGRGIAERYFSYFDLSFLFVTISENAGRQVIPNVGFLYLIEAPLFLVGIFYLFKHLKSKQAWIVIGMLLASPLAASMVVEPRSTIRSIVMAVPMSVIISSGIYQLIKVKRVGNYLLAAVLILYIANVSYFLHEYFIHKPLHHPWYSDVGLSEIVSGVSRFQGNYSAVVMSHSHYMPYLFFNKVKPGDFIANSDFYDNPPAGLVRVKRYGKVYFSMPYDCPNAGKLNVLYICFGTKVPKFATVIDVIRYRDSLPAIFFVEFTGSISKIDLPERLTYGDSDSRFPTGLIPDSSAAFWPQN